MEPAPALSDYLKLSSKTSTFVSIDVVGSTGLKAGENEQDVLYTFLSYHKLVSDLAYAHHGEVIHITGDGIMCRFPRAEDGVALGEALFEQLALFNKKQNRLSRPVALRAGVHTGQVLESAALSAGQLISQTLDVTAKLQQGAPPDHVRISEAALSLAPGAMQRCRRIGWDAGLQTTVYEGGPRPAAPAAARKLPEPAKLLIAEQELDEILRLKKTLLARRHEVFAVYTAAQAALCAAAWEPHLMMVSADLPWDAGWRLLGDLRGEKKFSGIPIILISRQTTGEVIQKGFRLGANGFLAKPVDEQQLAKRVEMALREFYL